MPMTAKAMPANFRRLIFSLNNINARRKDNSITEVLLIM
jgi:hypothetical protein